MASHFELLSLLTQQMYDDIKFISENNPTQVVDEDTARMFNTLLKDIRLAQPEQEMFNFFFEMSPRTLKYKDALVVCGQLNCLVNALSNSEVDYEEMIRRTQDKIQKPHPSQFSNRPIQTGKAETVDESIEENKDSIDEELYGTTNLRMNKDGIVPFNLSED